MFQTISHLNVPRVHFYEGGKRCPEDLILPSCLRAIAEFFGEEDFGCKHCLAQTPNCKVNCSYSFLVGVSGAASFLSWKEGWHEDNSALAYLSRTPFEPERRIFAALGYEYDLIQKTGSADEDLFRRSILESLQAGAPVLAYGVIGPPEPCIVTGYSPQDDALIGWNYFQNMPSFASGVSYEPGGEFHKTNWYADTHSLIVIHARRPHPPLKETYLKAFQWLAEVIRTPMVRPEADAPETFRLRHNGLAAYSAWAEHLLRDEDFKADDTTLRQHHAAHDFQVGNLAEARWYGSQFLIEAANPDFHPPFSLGEELYRAAGCYAGQHDLMWDLWNLAGGNGNPEAYLKFADPAIRRQMVPIILRARDKEVEALECLERAIAKRL